MRRYSKRAAAASVLVAGVSASVALAVPPPPDGSFSGVTAQERAPDRDVRLSTDSAGQISQFGIEWRAKCKREGRFWSAGTAIRGRAIQLQGETFGADGSYNSNASRKIKGVVTISMRGTFTDENTAAGTWDAKVVVRKRGKKIDKCKVATTWSAQRDG